MIEKIAQSSNLDEIAIVCVGYNRLTSMKRLLSSLLNADYPRANVPLVISIDASGCTELYEYVRGFNWPFGEKYVFILESRLGLKNHILKCGDLTRYFKGIILLEDDIFVSPYFYRYAEQALDKYGENRLIAQISLYTNETNGYVGLPLSFVKNNSDTFLMQDVSTWGECWNFRMWNEFRNWLDSHSEDYVLSVDMPVTIKKWTKAWSKYYNAFVVDTGKYVLYPRASLTTNFSDAGVHGGDNNSLVQVNLLDGPVEYRFDEIENLVKYDIYYNNMDVYDWLETDKEDICLDLYGFNENIRKKRYILSVKKLSYRILKRYALNMRPIELNIKYGIEGEGIYLYDTEGKTCRYPKAYPYALIEYFLQGFSHKPLIAAPIRYYWSRLKARL